MLDKPEWEYVCGDKNQNSNSGIVTERLRVPGGWLYHRKDWGSLTVKNQITGKDDPQSISVTSTMCFLPEPSDK